MDNKRTTCDPERIELFLQQKVSDEEQTAFELHLDHCQHCRERLEAAAAGGDVWSGVGDALRGQQLPADSPRAEAPALPSAADEDASSDHAMVLKLLAPTDEDRMLGRLGTYEILGVIGSGGMGIVLKALDPALNRYVAIKVLAPHLGNSGGARRRFAREAQAAAAVVHNNVMEIYGVADTAGLSYLVMPYVRGPSLQRRLDEGGPLALVEILRIGMQAAAGLAAAHAQGLVHRDVKPANILLADGVERVKLTDFGLARAADDASLTKSGIIAGTPQYMSPEQARGESVDPRSDLFSLGSVFYAMCTGRAPFRGETSYGVLRRITDEEPRPIRQLNPDIPDWLCSIVARLMSKDPGARFQSAGEVAELLEECLAHVQQPTMVLLPAALSVRPERPAFRLRQVFLKGGLTMIATLGIALLGVFVMQSIEPPDMAGRRSGEGVNVAPEDPFGGPQLPPNRKQAETSPTHGAPPAEAAPPENLGRPSRSASVDLVRFARLPEEQQKAAMIEGIKRIQQKCANVSLRTTTCVSKVSGDPRKTGGSVTVLGLGVFGTHAYELRRIGSSYQVRETVTYARRQEPTKHLLEHGDADSGVARYLQTERRADGTDRNLAWIRKVEPGTHALCRYACCLGGLRFTGTPEGDFLKILLDHQNALRVRGIDQQSRLVEVGVAYTEEPETTVSCTAWLDAGKDWMLRRMGLEKKYHVAPGLERAAISGRLWAVGRGWRVAVAG